MNVIETIKSANLYFKEGSSDKVYHATLEKDSEGYVVNFAYGRRGNALQTGTKTNSPTSLENATKIFEKLVNEKMAKGYKPIEGSKESIPVVRDLPDTPTGIECVLLNPVDEDECERLLDDPSWVAQPKFDGVRFMLGRKEGKLYALNRKGKRVSVPNQIELAALSLDADGDYLLDGELVGDTLYVFDLLEIEGECRRNYPLEERVESLPVFGTDCIQVVPLKFLKSKRTLYNKLVKNNAEGIVFKRLGSKYSVGRPASGGNYLKFKFYSTASCVVSKVNQKRSVSLKMSCGTEVGNVTIPANHEIPNEGDIVEVRYLYAYKEGSLYQPIYLGTRDDVDPDHVDSLKFKSEEE